MRLFVAIELDEDLSTKLIDFQSSFETNQARAVPPANYHITLSFLGEVSENQLDTILSNLTSPHVEPFEVDLQGLLYWPKPQIVAIDIDDTKVLLLSLKKDIESQLNQLGFRQFDKKKFHPHITLFRNADSPLRNENNFEDKVAIKGFSLMQSQNGRDGVFYQTIEYWPLLSKQSIKSQLLGR